MNMISHGQRGRMDDQRCTLDPSKSAPCTPKNTDRKLASSGNTGEGLLLTYISPHTDPSCIFILKVNHLHVTNSLGFVFPLPQVQILTCSSISWPTPKATGLMTSECLYSRYRDYRKRRPHLPLQEIQATCVTWSLKSRFVLFIFRTKKSAIGEGIKILYWRQLWF